MLAVFEHVNQINNTLQEDTTQTKLLNTISLHLQQTKEVIRNVIHGGFLLWKLGKHG